MRFRQPDPWVGTLSLSRGTAPNRLSEAPPSSPRLRRAPGGENQETALPRRGRPERPAENDPAARHVVHPGGRADHALPHRQQHPQPQGAWAPPGVGALCCLTPPPPDTVAGPLREAFPRILHGITRSSLTHFLPAIGLGGGVSVCLSVSSCRPSSSEQCPLFTCALALPGSPPPISSAWKTPIYPSVTAYHLRKGLTGPANWKQSLRACAAPWPPAFHAAPFASDASWPTGAAASRGRETPCVLSRPLSLAGHLPRRNHSSVWTESAWAGGRARGARLPQLARPVLNLTGPEKLPEPELCPRPIQGPCRWGYLLLGRVGEASYKPVCVSCSQPHQQGEGPVPRMLFACRLIQSLFWIIFPDFLSPQPLPKPPTPSLCKERNLTASVLLFLVSPQQ